MSFLGFRTNLSHFFVPQRITTIVQRDLLFSLNSLYDFFQQTMYNNYKSIEFFPNKFQEFLLSTEVGFSHTSLLGILRHAKGFKRSLQVSDIYSKYKHDQPKMIVNFFSCTLKVISLPHKFVGQTVIFLKHHMKNHIVRIMLK